MPHDPSRTHNFSRARAADLSERAGYDAAIDLLGRRRPPDAIVAAVERPAIGVLAAAESSAFGSLTQAGDALLRHLDAE